jgi:hypothetical protein
VTSGEHDFEKFREKKINERSAAQHEDDAAFFGTFKKKEPEEDGPKKLRVDDLNLPENERPENVPKVGESLKLIDIALEGGEPAPQKVAPSHVQPNAPPRPGTRPLPGANPPAPTARGKPGATPAPRATQKPTPRATGTPATPPSRTWGAPPARATGPQAKPGAPTPPQGTPPVPPAAKPRPAGKRPGSQPLAGFQDRAHESGPHEIVRQDHFEDTTFVEASEHEDPYEFRDQGPDSGLGFVDDPADAAKKTRSGRNPAVKKPGGAGASGKNKAIKPPGDPKSKSATNRTKRPFGR